MSPGLDFGSPDLVQGFFFGGGRTGQQLVRVWGASSHSVPSSGPVSTPNSRQEDCTDDVLGRCIFASPSRQLKVGKEVSLKILFRNRVLVTLLGLL